MYNTYTFFTRTPAPEFRAIRYSHTDSRPYANDRVRRNCAAQILRSQITSREIGMPCEAYKTFVRTDIFISSNFKTSVLTNFR